MGKQMDVGWGYVHERFRQLGVLRDRLAEVEKEFQESFEVEIRGDSSDPNRGLLARAEFRLQGETCFMFAEAALNCLADVAVETELPGHDYPWSFQELAKSIVTQSGSKIPGLLNLLAPHRKSLQAARVRVLLPRAAMSVHPPAGLGASGYSFAPGKPIRLEAWRRWPDLQGEQADAARLKQALETDLPVPPEVDSVGRFLVVWALDDAAEDLNSDSLKELRSYVLRHGCSASPSRALDLARDVVVRVGTSLGYAPS